MAFPRKSKPAPETDAKPVAAKPARRSRANAKPVAAKPARRSRKSTAPDPATVVAPETDAVASEPTRHNIARSEDETWL